MGWLRKRAKEAADKHCECGHEFGYCEICAGDQPSLESVIEAVAREFAERALKSISTVGPDVGLRKGMYQAYIQRAQCGLPTLAHAYNELDEIIARALEAADEVEL